MNCAKHQSQRCDHQCPTEPDARASPLHRALGSFRPPVEHKKKPAHAYERRKIPKEMKHADLVPHQGADLGLEHEAMEHKPPLFVCKGVPENMRPGANQHRRNKHQGTCRRIATKRLKHRPISDVQRANTPRAYTIKSPKHRETCWKAKAECPQQPM